MKSLVLAIVAMPLILGQNLLARDEPSAIHGMLLVGSTTLYLSPLPMFHTPHDSQVILKVTLSAADASPQAVYLKDQTETQKKRYTLVPEQTCSLQAVVQAGHSFQATLFRGHFERGGVPIFNHATVSIQSVIYFHKFDSADQLLPNLEDLLFGKPGEFFLAHRIVRCPHDDQILSVQLKDLIPLSGPMGASAIPFSRANDSPLIAGETAVATVGLASVTTQAHVDVQIYMETGDFACIE